MQPTIENKLFSTLMSDATLDAAYDWVAAESKESAMTPREWEAFKPEMQTQLTSGEYSFAAQTRVHGNSGMWDLWLPGSYCPQSHEPGN